MILIEYNDGIRQTILCIYYFVNLCNFLLSIALTVSFDQETYEFNEENGVAQPVLVLSSPSSVDIIVIVNSSDSTAISQYNPLWVCDYIRTYVCYR